MKTSNKVQQVTQVIEDSNGRMITVVFEKADGTLRTMNGRTGVKKHLKGGTKTYDAQDTATEKTIGLFETGVGYRCFKASRVVSVTTNKVTVTFN
ncbi:hypothetical protein N8314_03970 [Akkermansiaceae bacterium]|nr:hypothetical protein [Akkermansiaceae bacterium]